MDIEKIIYETTRDISNLADKLRIATIFIFCKKMDDKKYAELLYTNSQENFIKNISKEYESFDVDFTINFSDKVVKQSFYKTLYKIIEKDDSDGYFKALYNEDAFANAIYDIKSIVGQEDIKRMLNECGKLFHVEHNI